MRLSPVLLNNGQEATLLEKELTDKIIHAAIEVHKALGPGLLESAYQTCMVYESNLLRLNFEQQIPLIVNYKGLQLDGGYRLDLVYEKRVIVELKAVEQILPVHEAQRLCCMNKWNGRSAPTHKAFLANAVAIRHTQTSHPVQCHTFDPRFSLLALRLPSVEMIAKDGFEAKHGRFGQRTTMIATLYFPFLPATLPNPA